MADFLSTAWLAELSEAGGGDVGDHPVVVQQLVHGGPHGEVAFVVEVGRGALRARPGRDEGASITLVEAWDTAVRLHRGDLTLREALLLGRIRVRGDVRRLLEAGAALGDLPTRLGPLRDRTTVA